jgi:hypothetical protein
VHDSFERLQSAYRRQPRVPAYELVRRVRYSKKA